MSAGRSAETNERLAALETMVREQGKHLDSIESDVREIRAQANRWKGAFVVLLSLGAVLGWLANFAKDAFR